MIANKTAAGDDSGSVEQDKVSDQIATEIPPKSETYERSPDAIHRVWCLDLGNFLRCLALPRSVTAARMNAISGGIMAWQRLDAASAEPEVHENVC